MNEQQKQNPLDEQTITGAAEAAISDLQLDTQVKSVAADGEKWCIQFSDENRQLSDTFRDQFDNENSFELIREKVKRHLLKQQQARIRSNVRVRRGKQPPPRATSSPANLFETAVETVTELAGQTARLTTEIVNEAARLPKTVIETATEMIETANSTFERETQPLPASSKPTEQPLVRLTVKTASSKSRKKASVSTRKASKTKGRAAVKKAGVKKAGSKTGRTVAAKSKKSSAKKSGGKSSERKK